jgi:hypothetical protein
MSHDDDLIASSREIGHASIDRVDPIVEVGLVPRPRNHSGGVMAPTPLPKRLPMLLPGASDSGDDHVCDHR